MHPLEKEICRLIREKGLIKEGGEKVIVAVSGGPDSIALLHVLSRLSSTFNFDLVAVYVNHGIRRTEAAREEALVSEMAAGLGTGCEIGRVKVKEYAGSHGLSIEHAGRLLRYAFLEQTARKYHSQKIALAHTADDQTEEILLRLLRGTGRKGLSGMKTMRRGKYIRPFLTIRKAGVLDYLDHMKVDFVEDSTNRQRIYLRNRVRLDLLPYLTREFNPNICRTLLQTAKILGEEEELLAGLADTACKSVLKMAPPALDRQSTGTPLPEIEIDLERFTAQPKAIQRRILEEACWRMLNKPSFRQIEQLLRLAHAPGSGNRLHLAKGLRVRKSAGRLYFSYPSGMISRRGDLFGEGDVARDFFEVRISGPGKWTVEQTGLTVVIDCLDQVSRDMTDADGATEYLDLGHIAFPLTMRSPRTGDKFHPLGSSGRKKVSEFLIDRKVPREKRWQVPVLLSGKNIIALLGHCIDHGFRITADTSRALKVRWRYSPR